MNDTIDFSVVMGLSVLNDGGVLVASDLRNNIQYFNARGQRTRSVGREGRGPGEFQGIRVFFRFGDSLALIDMQGIGQVFTVNGRYIRSEKAVPPSVFIHGYFTNGERVLGTLNTQHITSGRWSQATEELAWWRGESTRPLGAFPSQELTRTADGRLKGNVYSARNRVAVLGQTFCAGYAGDRTLGCFDLTGKRVSTIVLQDAKVIPVTKADEEAYFNDIYEINDGESRAKLDAQVRAARERVTFAKSMGMFGRLLTSRDNRLWVGPPSTDDGRRGNPNPPPTTPTTWRVYSSEGEWLANVALPAGFYLLEAGADYVAGVTKDKSNLEEVQVYALRKR